MSWRNFSTIQNCPSLSRDYWFCVFLIGGSGMLCWPSTSHIPHRHTGLDPALGFLHSSYPEKQWEEDLGFNNKCKSSVKWNVVSRFLSFPRARQYCLYRLYNTTFFVPFCCWNNDNDSPLFIRSCSNLSSLHLWPLHNLNPLCPCWFFCHTGPHTFHFGNLIFFVFKSYIAKICLRISSYLN